MSQILLFPGASSGPTAPAQLTYEYLGFTASGNGITATANASANVKGAASNTLGTTTAAYCGFTLYVIRSSSGVASYLVDISFDGGSTWAIQNLFFWPGSAGPTIDRLNIPVIIPVSSDVRIRCQASTGSATIICNIVGWIAGTNAPIGYTSMTSLFADTTNTKPGSTSIAAVGSGSTTYQELTPSLGASYDALMAVATNNGTVAANTQSVTFTLATGGSGSEAAFYRWTGGQQASATIVFRLWSALIYKSVASGARLSAQALSNTPSTDAFFMNVYGFTA